MSEEHAVPESPELEALHQRLAENSLGGHWQSREKPPKLKPWVWPWSAIYSCLMESGEVVKLGGIDDAAKRRTVQLVNPAITNLKATSRTIQMSIQFVKPGERAECHRHYGGGTAIRRRGRRHGLHQRRRRRNADGARRSGAHSELDLA